MEKQMEQATPALSSKLKKISPVFIVIMAGILIIPYPPSGKECFETASLIFLASIPFIYLILGGLMVFIKRQCIKYNLKSYNIRGLIKPNVYTLYILVVLAPVHSIVVKNMMWMLGCDFWPHAATGLVCYILFCVWGTRWIDDQVKAKPSEGEKR